VRRTAVHVGGPTLAPAGQGRHQASDGGRVRRLPGAGVLMDQAMAGLVAPSPAQDQAPTAKLAPALACRARAQGRRDPTRGHGGKIQQAQQGQDPVDQGVGPGQAPGQHHRHAVPAMAAPVQGRQGVGLQAPEEVLGCLGAGGQVARHQVDRQGQVAHQVAEPLGPGPPQPHPAQSAAQQAQGGGTAEGTQPQGDPVDLLLLPGGQQHARPASDREQGLQVVGPLGTVQEEQGRFPGEGPAQGIDRRRAGRLAQGLQDMLDGVAHAGIPVEVAGHQASREAALQRAVREEPVQGPRGQGGLAYPTGSDQAQHDTRPQPLLDLPKFQGTAAEGGRTGRKHPGFLLVEVQEIDQLRQGVGAEPRRPVQPLVRRLLALPGGMADRSEAVARSQLQLVAQRSDAAEAAVWRDRPGGRHPLGPGRAPIQATQGQGRGQAHRGALQEVQADPAQAPAQVPSVQDQARRPDRVGQGFLEGLVTRDQQHIRSPVDLTGALRQGDHLQPGPEGPPARGAQDPQARAGCGASRGLVPQAFQEVAGHSQPPSRLQQGGDPSLGTQGHRTPDPPSQQPAALLQEFPGPVGQKAQGQAQRPPPASPGLPAGAAILVGHPVLVTRGPDPIQEVRQVLPSTPRDQVPQQGFVALAGQTPPSPAALGEGAVGLGQGPGIVQEGVGVHGLPASA